MKKKRLRKSRAIIFSVFVLLGVLLILECAARFVYYQRYGKHPVALIRAISFIFDSGDKSAPLFKKGLWRPIKTSRSSNELTVEQKRKIQQLRSIGYLSGSQKPPQQQNVTIYDRSLVCQGLNFVVAAHAPEACLMDMTGRVIHKWECDIYRVWPDFDPETFMGRDFYHHSTFWRRAHIMQNGDLLAIFDGIGLIKLDKNSNIIWSAFNGAHHDLHVARNGSIYVLTRKAHINKQYNPKDPILEDFISILNPDGKELEKISILDALKNSFYAPVLKRGRTAGDIFHTNTIELIEKQPPGCNHPLKQGTVLISILRLDFICAIDLVKRTAYWGASDYWKDQHQPTLLSNGNMLIFDNRGFSEQSTILEFDPNSRDIKWFYRGTKDDPFFTLTCGSCQRLFNGNTLITESESGRAFEVTAEKQIVWEYINPQHAGEKNEYIAILLEVIRLSQDFPTDWLSEDITHPYK
jgi:hypothetical protein